MSQIKKKGIEANAVDETQIRLSNNAALRGRNAANSADVDIIKLDSSDRPAFSVSPYVGANKLLDASQLGANSGIATLDSGGKIPSSQLSVGVMSFAGDWDGSTNTPTLADGTGASGTVYRVTTAGTVDFGNGSIVFAIGDWVYYDGVAAKWKKAQNSDVTSPVTSVNGQSGVVVLTSDNISEGSTNLYFTSARAKTAAVVNSLGGSQTDQAPSVASVNTALAAKQASLNSGVEHLTLNSTDITNQYKDLAQTVINGSLIIKAYGVVQTQGTDYTLSVVSTKTRVTFSGDIATGGASPLTSGDVLEAQYEY